MKISVVVDESGTILGALIPSLAVNQPRAQHAFGFNPSESQSVHQADLPEELFEHLGKKTLAPELMKYRIEKSGKKVRLTRD